MSKSKEPYTLTANSAQMTSAAAATLTQQWYRFSARQLLPYLLSVKGGPGCPALHHVSSPFYTQRHSCGASKLLNIIIFLYCKCSKPYVVCNNTGINQCFSYPVLFLTTMLRLGMDYRHLLLNCAGNSIFTLKGLYEVFKLGTDSLCTRTTVHIWSTDTSVIC